MSVYAAGALIGCLVARQARAAENGNTPQAAVPGTAAPAIATVGNPQPVPPLPPPATEPRIGGVPVASARGADTQTTETYRVQVLIADLVAGTLAFGIAARDHSADSIILWPFASPVVHAVHRNWGSVFGSLALNLLVPFIGALVGKDRGGDSGHGDGDGAAQAWGALHGAEIGAVVAGVLDVAFLASKTTEVPSGSASRGVTGATQSMVGAPMLGILATSLGSVTLGWRGTF